MPRYVWQSKGKPHSSPAMVRAQKRFRRHVQTPHRPRARIIRPWRCPKCGRACETQPIEAHHVDYRRPFLVAWLCGEPDGCHRKVERGEIKLCKRDLFDYTSLVPQRPYQEHGKRRKIEREPVPF